MRFQHSDNKIHINDHVFPYDWWVSQEPNYSGLPENCIARIYVPGKRHHLTILKGETPCQNEGEHENHVWAEGDRYIAKEQDYINAYHLHLSPPLTPEQQRKLDNDLVQYELKIIDQDSIRSLREWVLSQTNPPNELLEIEDKAKKARDKIK